MLNVQWDKYDILDTNASMQAQLLLMEMIHSYIHKEKLKLFPSDSLKSQTRM